MAIPDTAGQIFNKMLWDNSPSASSHQVRVVRPLKCVDRLAPTERLGLAAGRGIGDDNDIRLINFTTPSGQSVDPSPAHTAIIPRVANFGRRAGLASLCGATAAATPTGSVASFGKHFRGIRFHLPECWARAVYHHRPGINR